MLNGGDTGNTANTEKTIVDDSLNTYDFNNHQNGKYTAAAVPDTEQKIDSMNRSDMKKREEKLKDEEETREEAHVNEASIGAINPSMEQSDQSIMMNYYGDEDEREDQPDGDQDTGHEENPDVNSDTTHEGEELPNKSSVWYKTWKFWRLYLGFVLVTAIVGLGVAIGCSLDVVHQMGFTSTGIAKNSYASRLMSSTSHSNHGVVPHESWVAWLQNVGRRGFVPIHKFNIGLLGALAGAVVGTMLFCIAMYLYYMMRRLKKKVKEYRMASDGVPLIPER
ncbi:uncharacterized protein LOC121868349 [Homarus americanus]|uniref:Interferon alpha-inducible protein 27-like n=1 Tax=Homarus americanus TaxID=6706 RepID=A0A8J5K5R2_HOMAM|nr:uncharacterized protein LOC121868349 [Homarus americanus]XP_042224796.1 uncharacterized protein LOC121868349 [Homarus americanus]XP_042224797.1 uncharacterized protein LOC121868349 [Homarus americanus]KAG7167500.1 Interferon alpha-inducible protein 27-like [Homarus americanus]